MINEQLNNTEELKLKTGDAPVQASELIFQKCAYCLRGNYFLFSYFYDSMEFRMRGKLCRTVSLQKMQPNVDDFYMYICKVI